MADQKRKGLSRLNKAILFLITSAFFFALMNMFVRLSGDVPTIQKTFFRNFFALFIASGAMIKNRCSIILPKGARFDLFMRAACGTPQTATTNGVMLKGRRICNTLISPRRRFPRITGSRGLSTGIISHLAKASGADLTKIQSGLRRFFL